MFIVIFGTAAALGITAWAGVQFTVFTTQVCLYLFQKQPSVKKEWPSKNVISKTVAKKWLQ